VNNYLQGNTQGITFINSNRLLGMLSLQDVLEAFKSPNMPKKSVKKELKNRKIYDFFLGIEKERWSDAQDT
jgi:hypothetical protein